MAKFLYIFVLIIFAVPLNEGARILVLFPFPSRSHNILGEGVVRILLQQGHEVTYITPYPKTEVTPNLRYIDISANAENFMMQNDSSLDLKKIADKTADSLIWTFARNIFTSGKDGKAQGFASLPTWTFASEDMKKLLNDPKEKFDLVIIEWMFSELYAGIAAVFDCPYIWISSSNPHWMVLRLIDEVPNPAYNPEIMSSNIPPLSFFERARELFMTALWMVLKMFMQLGDEKTYNDVFAPIMAKRGRTLPPFEDMIYSASLMLGNTHESLSWSRNLPQNFKSVGGYHIDPKVKPLPTDLQKIMDNAKEGVIYFSLGSNVKSKDLPDEIKQSLLKMFKQLKYTVIWKFEEELSGVPKNVHILQWAPQASILAHPNCKLFITHGGLLSTIETIHFGVPIIGVPVFADQFINVELSKKKGFALRVDISYEMANDLKEAIDEILGNPRYKQMIDKLNLIYHDRPVPPAQEFVHWVNHVIRTNGAPHLRSIALVVPWWQKLYLDLLTLVLFVIFIIVKVLKVLCCTKKKAVSSKKKNN